MFIRKLAKNYLTICSEHGTVHFEVDDLVQESYFALLDAIKYYNPTKGSFVTFLSYKLKNTFAQVAGNRYGYSKTDAIKYSVSSDVPMSTDTEDTFVDIFPSNENVEETVFDKLYVKELRQCMENALKTLPSNQEQIIRALYYKNITVDKLANNLDCTIQNINKHKNNALKKLREEQKENGLAYYLSELTDYYTKVGVKEFKNSRISAVEKIVLKREELTYKWLKNHYSELSK